MDITPNAPLFRDPIYDGAADPTIIKNQATGEWWLIYTNRRASAENFGVAYCHGTDIGAAVSSDGGKTWLYRGTLNGLEFEPGRNTFWAPEVIFARGVYHMYVSYIRGVPSSWTGDRNIVHYTSTNLWDWKFESILPLSSNRVIDACVYEIKPGKYKMWYKDEANGSHSYTAYSDDLYNWTCGSAEITDCGHEGPNVFSFGGSLWMMTDVWDGFGIYRCSGCDDSCVNTWVRQEQNILRTPGKRKDDGTIGGHGDVLVYKDRAYVFYFTHPEVSPELRRTDFEWEYRHRRTSLQVAELKLENGSIVCDRDNVSIDLT